MLPTLYAVADAFTGSGCTCSRYFPEMLVHPIGRPHRCSGQRLLAGGLVLSAPWTAYQASSYAARRAKPGGAGRIGSFVTASTAVVWGSAWLVPNLLVPALPLRGPFHWPRTLTAGPNANMKALRCPRLLDLVCAHVTDGVCRGAGTHRRHLRHLRHTRQLATVAPLRWPARSSCLRRCGHGVVPTGPSSDSGGCAAWVASTTPRWPSRI